MTAIITCGETRQSLAAARALGRVQIPIAVGANIRPNLAMWSKYASSTFLTEDPSTQAELFAEQIAEELRARYATCALVSTDHAFWALSRFRDLLPIAARSILPPHYSVVRSLDHEALHYFAQSLGILCAPLVRVPENLSEDEVSRAVEKLSFPMLIRPIIPWAQHEDYIHHIDDREVVYSKEHLLSIFRIKPGFRNGFLASAYSGVKAIAYFGVASRGNVLVEGFQERLSELVPYSEISTLAMTINPIPSIRSSAKNLLSALQWQGPFKVEFIKDQNGNFCLISLIGRLWGSLQLAIKANMNIPLICYRLAEGTITKDILHNAKQKIRVRWLMGDISAKISHPLLVAKNFKKHAHSFAIKHFYNSHFGKNKIHTFYDVLDLDDPMPFLFELQHKTWKKAFGQK
jgi:hypothetical protein